jgi:hypothetical protein
METKWLIILTIILFILIILNNVYLIQPIQTTQLNSISSEQSISNQFGYMQTPKTCSNLPGCCSLTQYGCCPDGINSRINQMGSNCPITYNPSSKTNTNQIPPQYIIKPLPIY